MSDIISRPNHYCEGRRYEPKDVIRKWGLNFNLGNAVKYISRAGRKDNNSKKQDLQKSLQYIKFEHEYLGNETSFVRVVSRDCPVVEFVCVDWGLDEKLSAVISLIYKANMSTCNCIDYLDTAEMLLKMYISTLE